MDNKVTTKEYEILDKAIAEYLKNGTIESKCPRCRRPLIYENLGSLEIIRCEDKTCVKSIRRGI